MTKNAEGVLLKKSKLTTNGKPNLPAPSKLVEGELAINYAEGVETISTKNESGTVVTFSSDDYYTSKKLGDYFTGENSAKTVTDVMIQKERVTAEALIDLDNRKADYDEIPEQLWLEGSGTGAVKLNTNSTASGELSVSEGSGTTASGPQSHAEGYNTKASGYQSHTEGWSTSATSQACHAEGDSTKANNTAAHAEGGNTIANGEYSHAEGYVTSATSNSSHAEGNRTRATGYYSHAEGKETSATSNSSHAEGYQTNASGQYSHAEGEGTSATNGSCHAEGEFTLASGSYSHAEGNRTRATGMYTHAEGSYTSASTDSAHAEGYKTLASGYKSHAEGEETSATTSDAHAEGCKTLASNIYTHAEGYQTKASAQTSHAEGYYSVANGGISHAEGCYTITNNYAEHASGNWNKSNKASDTFGDSGNTLFSVGNGNATSGRHNAFEIRENGDIYIVNKDGNDVRLQDEIGNIDVDQVLDETTSASTNPVATKAVYDVFHEFETVVSAAINDLETKKLEESDVDQVIDSTTSANTNPVSTSAVYGFVTSYTPSITVDQVINETTSGSSNPVSTKAVYSAITDNEMVWANAYVTISGAISSHTENTDVHVTAADKTKWNTVDNKLDTTAYTPTDLSNYYTKSETSGATEISNALADKSDTGHTHTLANITDVTAPLAGINSITGAVGTMAFENASSYSSATEVNSALSGKSDTGHTHSQYLTGITSSQVTTALGFTPADNADLTAHTADTSAHVTQELLDRIADLEKSMETIATALVDLDTRLKAIE